MNLKKIIFKNKKIIVTVGESQSSKVIFDLLKKRVKKGKIVEKIPGFFSLFFNNFFIIKADKISSEKLFYFLNFFQNPVLVLNDYDKKWIKNLVKKFPRAGFLISNFDSEEIQKISSLTNANILNFGFKNKSILRITDVKESEGLNFKINYKGKVIPFWYYKKIEKDKIYNLLTAICVGIVLEFNLVNLLEDLKKYNF